ncbi:LPXTG cell wall anchor domain-containing protein [Limosilactobacillus agrestimuris]|uniref:LPXTG cell wall anchor domain-containing protein n=1 Tax=Limosilactobacillus agrestimuris TaxID=2941331 RepID=UPI002041584C|nr:LPXTG cell wall anchor domain-containing protein [Limosilactobacillus agrestimuris]
MLLTIPSSPLKGQWNIEKATSEKVDGSPINTKDAPKENLSNDIADGTVENIYLIYTQPTNPDPVEPQPTTPGQPAQPGEPGGQPVSPDEGGNGNPGENVNVPVDNNQVPGHIANDQSLTSQIAHHVNGTNKQTHQLPQTGNGANEKASALGFLFAGLASIFSLAGRRKKKH